MITSEFFKYYNELLTRIGYKYSFSYVHKTKPYHTWHWESKNDNNLKCTICGIEEEEIYYIRFVDEKWFKNQDINFIMRDIIKYQLCNYSYLRGFKINELLNKRINKF